MKKLNNKGFTLTELIVVVVLIGILTTFALPRYMINVEISKAKEATDFLRQWQAARTIAFAETETYMHVNASELENLGLDNIWNDQQQLFSYFDCNHGDDITENSALHASRWCIRQDNNGFPYTIIATESALYCCWNDTDNHRSGKICNNISSGNSASSSSLPVIKNISDVSGMTCYTLQ